MEAWSMGDDYTEAFNTGNASKIDFDKDFDKQDQYTVVNHYFPGEFDKDDMEDTGDPTVKKAIDLAKRQYEIDKDNLRVQRASQEKRNQENIQKFKDSLDSSVQNLRQAFPGFSDSHFKRVEKVLKGGDINSLFFNNDSTYQSDAAEKLAFLMFGKEELLRIKNVSAKQSKSETLENVVSRGADKPMTQGNQNAVKTGDNKDVSKMFEGLIEKRHY
jgi:hypothetical protein